MKVISAMVMTAAITLASGCATNTQAPAPTASFGEAPVQYESVVRTYMQENLKDPMTAMYRFGKPVRAYSNYGWAEAHGGEVEWTGYLVRVDVNAKNGYGGYTGYHPYMFLFKGETLFRAWPVGEHPLVHVLPQ
jgi:hypothetical protein